METIALNPHAISVLALTVVALFLFSRESIPIETSSLLILAVLGVGFTVFPYTASTKEFDPSDFFLGFGNEALVAISALMVASEGLVRTGALNPAGRFVARHWTLHPRFSFVAMLVITAILSAFTNNTPQVVLMIPILVSVAMRSGMPASGMLMPMTFAAQIGGMATPIGTSLNLLVIGSAASLGVHKFGMFDFAAPAVIAGSVGLLFLWLVAPRLLPHRDPNIVDTSPRLFTARLCLSDEGAAVGRTLADAISLTGGRVKILRLERGTLNLSPLPDTELKGGDCLYVRDTPERLKEIEQAMGGVLYSGEAKVDEEHPLTAEDQQLAELVITPHSPLAGRTLNETDFDERYQLVPLAHHRADRRGQPEAKELASIRLRFGDVLLIQGPKERIEALRNSGDLMVLDATSSLPHTHKAPTALAIMAGVVALSSLKILPVSQSAVLGVLAMILTRCLDWRSATRALDAQMILLTVASIALSVGMVTTGAAGFIAQEFASVVGGLPGTWVVSALILFMAFMANIVSNSAAAVIGTPIAVMLARELGHAPEPFVLAVLFGVNMSYATPMADNCNLLVYSAGNYKFTDFLRAGIPLTLIMWGAYSVLLPMFFPL